MMVTPKVLLRWCCSVVGSEKCLDLKNVDLDEELNTANVVSHI